jgi:uncharacterized protein with NRDE domain
MDAVSQEKDTRELWIGRYEREQKAHMATSNELLGAKGQMQDLQLKVKQRELEVESVAKARDLHKHNNEKLISQLMELMAKKESAERDLFSKTELLRTVEEHQMIFIRKLQEDMKVLKRQRDWELQGKQMEIEDLRSYSR